MLQQRKNWTRRDFLKITGSSLAVAGLSGCRINQPPIPGDTNDRPNIILIMADDVGFEGFSCYGGTTYRTPHVDQLAENGIRFEHCHSTPLCTPSRVQIMTGKYNFRNYTEFGSLPQGETTFAHLLKEAGYKTCVAGKWQLSGLSTGSRNGTHPNDAGFDDYCLWQIDQLGSRYWNPVINKNGEYLDNLEGKYGPDVFCDHINNFVKDHKDERFFVYYPMVLPHSPFKRTPITNPSPDEQLINDRKHFKEMVEYTDQIVGRIVKNLDRLGLRENTLILFTGDNGAMRGISSQVGNRIIIGAKALTTDAGTHVPLVANWKGKIPEDVVCDDLIDFTDFLPTLLDAADTQAPSGSVADGRSFLPQLFGEKGNPREWIFCHYQPKWGQWKTTLKRFVHNKQWKIYDDGSIFDLSADILEENPLNREQLNPDVQNIITKFEKVLDQMK